MPRISVKCPKCQLGMTGTNPERFSKPITCPKCNNVFQVAVAAQTATQVKRSPVGLFALVGLALVLAAGVGAYFGFPLLKGDGRRGVGDPSGETGAGGGKRYALLIGVNEYQNLPNLRFAENDAAELADVLRRAGYEATLLTGTEGKKDANRMPTQGNVNAHLNRVAASCKKADTLVLAFAGHGMQFDDQAYFCPSDADEKSPESMVSLHRVYAEVGESRAGARLLLVDACRNEGRRGGRRGVTGTSRPPSGIAALFSCSEGEFANETDKAGGGHGIFFYYVLEGLRGAAMNEDGEVTWDRLNEFVKRQVSRNVEKMVGGGAKQTPHAMADLRGESPVLLRDPTKQPKTPDDQPVKPTDKDKTKGPIAKTPKDKDKSDAQKAFEKAFESRKDKATKTKLGDSFRNSVGMEFVRVEAGKFLMGSPKNEGHRSNHETQHEVELTKDFYLGTTEVTQAQWKAVMGKDNNPSFFSKTGKGNDKVGAEDTDKFPVETVSWEDTQKFLTVLNGKAAEKKFGVIYRLPSEAEWEYACRGGHRVKDKKDKAQLPFHFRTSSLSISSDKANFDGANPFGGGGKFVPGTKGDYLKRTCKVGKYQPNGLGLWDMHGNVDEWCQDWYEEAYTKEGQCDPTGPEKGTSRVTRGGNWYCNSWACRAASRGGYSPRSQFSFVGFRVAASPSPK